uniref:J domain-containing protein n=1 Tax=Globisporangium ultimum (strain ATCC 200006 / CBS 805.95 / DAOM BR144) TaxID=431595 RepID=K3WQH3_GLOUD
MNRSVPSRLIVHVCSKADENASPQACTLASISQLRWMDDDSRAYLCQNSVTADPVSCATELRRVFTSRSQMGPVAGYTASDVAEICHATQNTTVLVSCVIKTSVVKAFSAPQLSRLCSPVLGAETSEILVDVPAHSSECVAKAKSLLGFFLSSPLSQESADLLLTLCEQAMSNAPTICLSSVQYDQYLSKAQRVQLCRQARDASPQQCYSKLRHFIHSKKISVQGALELCQQAKSLSPALCFAELARTASTTFMENFGSFICASAQSIAPAKCYRATPSNFADSSKAMLCQFADSEAPAECALYHATRITTTLEKAQLCHQASSISPASCVMAAPFGMKSSELIALCRMATSDFSAKCAQSIATSARIPWVTAAELCVDATSVTPAHCLAQHVRRRALITRKLIQECRYAVATPASTEIAQVSYQCRELIPNCLITISLRVLDQFGEEMPAWTGGYVHIAATPTTDTSNTEHMTSEGRILVGQSHALIVNGTAVFKDISFAEAGEFIITFRPPSASSSSLIGVFLEEKIVRIRIHEDKLAQLRTKRCKALFARFQCSRDDTADPFHVLDLSNRFYLDAMSCEAFWHEHTGGLRFQGTTSQRLLYVIHRASYHFLTDASIPHAEMSPWACLGLASSANRSQIRRAYHRKSLEWHPDKWSSADTIMLRAQAEKIYALITHAYHVLFNSDP